MQFGFFLLVEYIYYFDKYYPILLFELLFNIVKTFVKNDFNLNNTHSLGLYCYIIFF